MSGGRWIEPDSQPGVTSVAAPAEVADEADALVAVLEAHERLAEQLGRAADRVGDRELGEEPEVVRTRELREAQLAAVAIRARRERADARHRGLGARDEAPRARVLAQDGEVERDRRAREAAGGAAPEALGLELLERARVVVVHLGEVAGARPDRARRDRSLVARDGDVGDRRGVDADRRRRLATGRSS